MFETRRSLQACNNGAMASPVTYLPTIQPFSRNLTVAANRLESFGRIIGTFPTLWRTKSSPTDRRFRRVDRLLLVQGTEGVSSARMYLCRRVSSAHHGTCGSTAIIWEIRVFGTAVSIARINRT